jgi:hypothetical protein
MLELCSDSPRRSVMSHVGSPTLSTRSQLRAHWVVAISALCALIAAAAVVLVLVIDDGASTTSGSVTKPQAALRSDGGPDESALAASVSSPVSVGPDESSIAASIGGPRMHSSGPDEAAIAASIGR